MGNYDLSGLSPRSFERLIQAIGIRILGPGLTIFGDGPDGGREATFQGKMDFPSVAAPWQGYCVVQAKFKERLQDPGRDGQWALEQLEAEFKKLSDPKTRARRPEYYLFATNVVLTPVAGKGGKDRFTALFAKYKKKLGIRGWHAWDFDQIRTYLDNYPEIRRTYAAWITPGDVLYQLLEQLQPRVPDFLDVMTNFLAKELLADQYANLGQAGHSAEEKIPLARIFVDLPTTRDRTADPPNEQGQQAPKVVELIAHLQEIAREKLAPLAAVNERKEREPGRYVLLGGPGQGKTTVGQFACQLFRVALLQDRKSPLSAEALQAMREIQGQSERIRLSLPKARRFPLRIVLSSFAAALEAASRENRSLSLLAYLTQRIKLRTDRELSPDDLRDWLKAYPWFLVLDGLDEVPASSNREALLRAIQDFWVDAAQAEADLLVLATTRPQGYGNEFSQELYQHFWLAPLSAPRALGYARQLTWNRWSDPEKREKVIGHLERASKEEATTRLMRSPLQVTIMATLVEQIGPPPQDRWRLFHLYYDVIFRREQERDIPAAEILRQHRPDIDAIHSQTGLILQIESEKAGSTEARLSAARFARIVKARLGSEGHVGTQGEALADQIMEAAANRLVFLVGMQEGQVGFEIRSLQEFMAAEALLEGGDTLVQGRLRHIAPLPSWRNVFLFAAGRCFALPHQQHRRDTFSAICIELNASQEDRTAKTVFAGSRLTLELIEDGLVRNQPLYAQTLSRCALELLNLPDDEVHGRLADIFTQATEHLLRDELERRIPHGAKLEPASWTALLALIGKGISWAESLAEKNWPTAPEAQRMVFLASTQRRAANWLAPKFLQSVHRFSPWDYSLSVFAREVLPPRHWWQQVSHWEPGPKSSKRLIHLVGKSPVGEFSSIGLQPSFIIDPAVSLVDPHPEALVILEGLKFAATPTSLTLADGLKLFLESDAIRALVKPVAVPWVWAACISESHDREKLAALVHRATAGELGDIDDWRAAEERWEKGVSVSDLLMMTEERWPFDREIALHGIALAGCRIYPAFSPMTDLDICLRLYLELEPNPRVQSLFAEPLIRLLGDQPLNRWPRNLSPHTVYTAIQSVRIFDYGLLSCLVQLHESEPVWLDCLELLGHKYGYSGSGILPGTEVLEALQFIYRGHPKAGLMRLINSLSSDLQVPSSIETYPELFEEPLFQHAALEIELSQRKFSYTRTQQLADFLVKISERQPYWVASAVSRIGGGSFDPLAEAFLLGIWQRLERNDWQRKAPVQEGLLKVQASRKSDLTNKKIWGELGLPGALWEAFEEP